MWIKTNNSAKYIPLLLGLFAMLTWSPITVYASEIPDTPIEEELLITADSIEPAVFSVTVPTSLPLYVDGYGRVTTAPNVKITNNSNGSVKVVDVSIASTGTYDIKSYDEDFSDKYINANELALSINGSKTQEDGALNFNATGFPVIQAGGFQYLDYFAKVTGSSAQREGEHVADVYITIDWCNSIEVTYDTRGGIFEDGTTSNHITYTETGKVVAGTMKEPTKEMEKQKPEIQMDDLEMRGNTL